MENSLSSIQIISEEKLAFSGSFRFDRLSAQQQADALRQKLQHLHQDDKLFSTENLVAYVRKLDWDSEFVGHNVLRIEYLFVIGNDFYASLADFKKLLQALKEKYNEMELNIELPLELTTEIQLVGYSGFAMVEPRLHYLIKKDRFEQIQSAEYKLAETAQADLIGQIAAQNVNTFDRLHADEYTPDPLADEYLRTYGANSAKGFCSEVLIPNIDPTDAFMAINHRVEELDPVIRHSRIVLTAVGVLNRGWHIKLMRAAAHRAQINNSDYLVMTTQAQNGAVIRNAEKLGFAVGYTSAVFGARL